MQNPKHFLGLDQLDAETLRTILDLSGSLKNKTEVSPAPGPLINKTIIMIFEKPSTRTRVSFQVGIYQLGGNVILLDESNSHLGRGETMADTGRVLSRYADAIILRTDDPTKLKELAENATIPVINGLTDSSHPCQIMADIMTFEEHRGKISGRTIAWIGDGNNVAISWAQASVRFNFKIRFAMPSAFSLPLEIVSWVNQENGQVYITEDPMEAVSGADLVITDTWNSMGNQRSKKKQAALRPYQVNDSLMSKATSDAIFMHCLPAHRGDEVTAEVLDGPQSVVWDEAENRLHAQKGILCWCLA